MLRPLRTPGGVSVGLGLLVALALGAAVAPAPAGSQTQADSETLSVFDRPATKRDRLKPRLRESLERSGFAQRFGADLDQSRQTVDLVWAIPAGENVCLVVETPKTGSAATCGPRKAAVKGMRLTGPYGRHGRFTAGLVGDGVSRVRLTFANGRSRTVPVVDNGFHSGPLKPGVAVKVSFE